MSSSPPSHSPNLASRLPPGLPQSLVDYTVEVTEPSLIYSDWHRARKRQLSGLIEQLVEQIRFGCQNETCREPTCFSFRQRLAGERPVRRFNTTAARALAVQIACQDDPWSRRCQLLHRPPRLHNLSEAGLTDTITKPCSKQRAEHSRSPGRSHKLDRQVEHPVRTIIKPRGEQRSRAMSGDGQSFLDSTPTNEDEAPDQTHASLNWEKISPPVKIDTKSFVQNLFNTVQCRLFDWVAPQESCQEEEQNKKNEQNGHPKCEQVEQSQAKAATDSQSSNVRSWPKATPARAEEKKGEDGVLSGSPSDEVVRDKVLEEQDSMTKGLVSDRYHAEEERTSNIQDAIPPLSPLAISRRRLGNVNAGDVPRELTEGTTIAQPTYSDPLQRHSKTRSSEISSAVSRLALTTKADIKKPKTLTDIRRSRETPVVPLNSDNETTGSLTSHALSDGNDTTSSSSVLDSGEDSASTPPSAKPVDAADRLYASSTKRPSMAGVSVMPTTQSLFVLDRAVMSALSELMPNIIRNAGAAQFTSLDNHVSTLCTDSQQLDNLTSRPYYSHYNRPTESFNRDLGGLPLSELRMLCGDILKAEAYRGRNVQICETITHTAEEGNKAPVPYSPVAKLTGTRSSLIWKAFIDQSIFLVFSEPSLLSSSFKNYKWKDQDVINDSQMIYHNMRMMLQYNRRIVLISLWRVASCLFHLPTELQRFCNGPPKGTAAPGAACEEAEAEDVLQLCLHGLVAALPAFDNPDRVFNISRRRSQGVVAYTATSHGSDGLLFDDVMSDELALRLARRVFTAIPARLQFQNLSRRVKGKEIDGSRESSEADAIASMVISRLTKYRVDYQCEQNFTKESRELYHRVFPRLLFDWALTVMTSSWDGSPIIPADSASGGALRTIDALYTKRIELSIVDGYFLAEILENRLDKNPFAVEWLSHTRNKDELHLLDYPYLFSMAARERYFRSINFDHMTRAYEKTVAFESSVAHMSQPMALMTDHELREQLGLRLQTALEPFLVLVIRRTHILEDAFQMLWRREVRELARPLKVKLGEGQGGEEGFDIGGVQQEFVRLAMAEALKPDYGLFTVDERTQMIWLQPSSPEPLWKFEMVGLIMSIAIYNGLTLPVTFPNAFYAKLLGQSASNINHIVDGWPELARSLDMLLEWNEDEQGCIDEVLCRTYEYSVPLFTATVTREMIPGEPWPQYADIFLQKRDDTGVRNTEARMVDVLNRDDYVADYIRWLTDVSIAPQFEAFKKGFFTCLHPKAIGLFAPINLSFLVEGRHTFSVADLRYYTRYEGYHAYDQYITDFWDVVGEYDENGKRKLLEFVTASERLPAAGMTGITFVISKNGEEEMDGHLPTAYTCYGTLLLPMYSSKEILKAKLGMAIQNAQGFGFA